MKHRKGHLKKSPIESMNTKDIILDGEFASLNVGLNRGILTPEKHAQDRALMSKPLNIWATENVLLTHYDRYYYQPYLDFYRTTFWIHRIDLPDRLSAKRWIIAKQLAEPKVHASRILWGLRYQLELRERIGPISFTGGLRFFQKARWLRWIGELDPNFQIADTLAEEYGIDRDTLLKCCRDAGRFASKLIFTIDPW